ncbi:DUF3293 domain-containing protein [Aestuariibacter halophilus]|uniref:DUF3293 domain-containing protein n=1 Tax=Fluctibacter halophilus TaxID=226011 RepID=A0ABS8GAQ1_9ALTE|nr:DUF3293 domain-containing protein [Aestuariibacter halophilus]MCC2617662.1 DUF3293 domain-containing protein [Aestuariibacter halophilus]
MSQNSNPTDLNALWNAYQQVRFIHADMPESGQRFAVITAWNPYSQALDAGQNDSRQRHLIQQVEQQGYRWWPVRVANKSLTYWEDSLMVVAPRAEAAALATTWQQNAFYWVQSGNIELVPLAPMAGFQPQWVGRWALLSEFLSDE